MIKKMTEILRDDTSLFNLLNKKLQEAQCTPCEREAVKHAFDESRAELVEFYRTILNFENLHGLQINKDSLLSFLVYVCKLHLGQRRKYENGKPYLVHLLRVATRALKYTPVLIAIYCRQDKRFKGKFYNLIKSKNDFVKELASIVLLSALAHDSVEDRSGKIIHDGGYDAVLSNVEKRALALDLIEKKVGKVARHYIATLTFIPTDKSKKEEEYSAWINAIFESQDPLGVALKLADIIDNVLSTDISKNKKHRKKISDTLRKYKQALGRFLEFVGKNTFTFAPQLQAIVQDVRLALEYIDNQLVKAIVYEKR